MVDIFAFLISFMSDFMVVVCYIMCEDWNRLLHLLIGFISKGIMKNPRICSNEVLVGILIEIVLSSTINVN